MRHKIKIYTSCANESRNKSSHICLYYGSILYELVICHSLLWSHTVPHICYGDPQIFIFPIDSCRKSEKINIAYLSTCHISEVFSPRGTDSRGDLKLQRCLGFMHFQQEKPGYRQNVKTRYVD